MVMCVRVSGLCFFSALPQVVKVCLPEGGASSNNMVVQEIALVDRGRSSPRPFKERKVSKTTSGEPSSDTDAAIDAVHYTNCAICPIYSDIFFVFQGRPSAAALYIHDSKKYSDE